MNPKQTQAATSSHSNNAERDAKRIETLFLRFAVIYGYVWQTLYQNKNLLDLAKKEWAATLQPFDNQIIKTVLHHCREHCPYPPNLPQFIDLCRAVKKRNNFVTRSTTETNIASPEVAHMHLQKIRAHLKLLPKGEK